jgi:hypothetical protein
VRQNPIRISSEGTTCGSRLKSQRGRRAFDFSRGIPPALLVPANLVPRDEYVSRGFSQPQTTALSHLRTRLKDAPSQPNGRCSAINTQHLSKMQIYGCSCFRRRAQAIIPARRRNRPQFRGFFHSSACGLALSRSRRILSLALARAMRLALFH